MTKMNILEQLAPKSAVEVEVKFGYGRKEVVTLAPLTWHEWNEVGEMVADPVVPRTLIAADKKTRLPNTADTSYQMQLYQVSEQRAALRLTFSLTKAGHDIPGEDLEAQASALMSSIDLGVARTLCRFLESQVGNGEAQIVEAEKK